MTAYPELRPCIRCLRVTRPKNRKADLYPFETVSRANGKLCCGCYSAERYVHVVNIPETAHEVTLRGLSNFLQGRHQRMGAK